MAFVATSAALVSSSSSLKSSADICVQRKVVVSKKENSKTPAFSVTAEAKTETSRRQFAAAGAALLGALFADKAFAYTSADERVAGLGGDLNNIDLNNVNVSVFRNFPGMYPNVARKVLAGAPYKDVQEVYSKANLNDQQKDVFKKYESRFFVTEEDYSLGNDRLNNGIYK
mmetsp:Transcript_11636/g.20260  ORF Transcript_11636/g.20260 Transcript_11636/m.20260 type:complete len:171 (+) Transcript_11636:101-613(+)|eukprot:CAMPEP_0196653792 /NCGR_PEP_ID=MMETSP1086-20130531/3442_1 /TAXON_ID=77921 /ORGANISM="Cyanoptyche  gloeocystis , Strain SAG4.97" /LENGTH=170 /DNA_ID=CAMNT_0041985171 /DNA_START=98 /DNA_END=610 /DNA_ORIENTATION=-